MHVSSTSNTNLWQLVNTAQTQQATASTTAASTNASNSSSSTGSSTSDSSVLSGPAKLISELQTLSTSNPTEFKKITGELATQLQKAASSATQPGQKDFLNGLAANFQKASETGSFSDLIPQLNHSPAGGETGTAPTPVGTGGGSTGGGNGTAPVPVGTGGGNGTGSTTGGTGGVSGTGLHYGPSPNGGDDTLASIFSQALSQVQSDLAG